MKNTKKNLGGLNFLMQPSQNIDTVKEVQENESSSKNKKESNNSVSDNKNEDNQVSSNKVQGSQVDEQNNLKSPAVISPLKFTRHISNMLYRQFDEQEQKRSFDKIYECGKKIGEGLHSSVYVCYKKQDQERTCPFAVKVTGFDDIE